MALARAYGTPNRVCWNAIHYTAPARIVFDRLATAGRFGQARRTDHDTIREKRVLILPRDGMEQPGSLGLRPGRRSLEWVGGVARIRPGGDGRSVGRHPSQPAASLAPPPDRRWITAASASHVVRADVTPHSGIPRGVASRDSHLFLHLRSSRPWDLRCRSSLAIELFGLLGHPVVPGDRGPGL